MKLLSKQIYIRPLGLDDVSDEYVSWLNDPKVNRFLEVRHQTHDRKSCVEFLASVDADQNSHILGIFSLSSDKHIGNIKVGFIDRYKSGQVSLLIGDRDYWGKGIGSEAIHLISKYSFRHLELTRLEAGCYEENTGSLRAFLKNGYTVEGFFRKSVELDGKRQGCFWLSLLKEEFGDTR